LPQRFFTYAGSFIKICLQKKAVGAIVNAALIFPQLMKLRKKNNKTDLLNPFTK